MSFLTNNGLLWLLLSLILALIILLIIYLIKPNFQQRFVSSTYVWELSLKYRKKKIPINRLRNILIIICQVLILAACAFIIARPAIQILEDVDVQEIVIVMDTSASMRTINGEGQTRAERAAEEAAEFGKQVLEDGGIVSVVHCGDTSELVLERVTGTGAGPLLEETLDDIAENGCTYAATNLNSALQICEDRILNVNPDAEIYIYTDAIYTSEPTGVNIEYIADEGTEWNAAIINAYTEKMDGYYALFVEFATYGNTALSSTALNFEITFKNPQCQNDKFETITIGADEYYEIGDEIACDGEQTMTYVVMFEDTYLTTYSSIVAGRDDIQVAYSPEYAIYYYEEIEISLSDVDDSYDLDNVYYVYGGEPQVIRVLYTTDDDNSNIFVPAALSTIQSAYSDVYDIIITYEYATSSTVEGGKEGYDLYIYEHLAPAALPKDGIVFLLDPNSAPEDAGFHISKTYEDIKNYDCYLYSTDDGDESPLMHNITAGDIFLTKASLIDDYENYVPLMEFTAENGTYPALLMRDDGDSKVLVMPFSVNYSNIALTVNFPLLFYNIFEYFYPTTITGTDYTVGDTIEVNSTGMAFELWRYYDEIWGQERDAQLLVIEVVTEDDESYYVVTDGWEETVITMPLTFTAEKPGRYLLRTESYFYDPDNPYQQKMTNITIFVHADLTESDIFAYGTALNSPYKEKDINQFYDDLLLWFAVALVALIFIEWILHMLEGL